MLKITKFNKLKNGLINFISYFIPMLTTIDNAVTYIVDTINKVEITEEPLEKDLVKETFTETLFDLLEGQGVSQQTISELEEHNNDQEFIEALLANKVSNYYTLLSNLSNEFIADYLSDEDKEVE